MRLDHSSASPSGWSTRPAVRCLVQFASVLLTTAILVPPVATFCVLVVPSPEPSRPVLSGRNGYYDLKKGGDLLQGAAEPNLDTATSQEVQAFLTRYRVALDTARDGLARECPYCHARLLWKVKATWY